MNYYYKVETKMNEKLCIGLTHTLRITKEEMSSEDGSKGNPSRSTSQRDEPSMPTDDSPITGSTSPFAPEKQSEVNTNQAVASTATCIQGSPTSTSKLRSPVSRNISGLPTSRNKTSPFKVKKSSNIRQFMAESKKACKQEGIGDMIIDDPYEKANEAKLLVRKNTALYLMSEELVGKHFCTWDQKHPECPSRVQEPIAHCRSQGLFERCAVVNNTELADVSDVLLYHTQEHCEYLDRVASLSEDDAEKASSCYDSIYLNPNVQPAALNALKTSMALVERVADGTYQNGFAFVRPPGHHAMHAEYNGYCYYNNVAIAVKNCINKNLAKKILIVDYDVHHGQGTQQAFYESNQVLYFSIHRYEHGSFWPHLRESNFDYVGTGKGTGYNVNVPLNETGLTDDDYLAIVMHILMPMAYEFNPDLVVISAGYDASIGCPEGEMRVSPIFYNHLVTLLSGLAKGKIAIIQEGGYFIPSLAEGICMTIKGLLGDPCPLLEPVQPPRSSVIDSINNVKTVLWEHWKCFNKVNPVSDVEEPDHYRYHKVNCKYFGTPVQPPFQTREAYPTVTNREPLLHLLHSYVKGYCDIQPKPVCYFYDEKMIQHCSKQSTYESPQRLLAIYEKFSEFGLLNRLIRVQDTRSNDILAYVEALHESNHVQSVLNSTVAPSKDLCVDEHTGPAVTTAVSGLLSLVDQVMTGDATSGIAVIRPPGHHADRSKADGFCFVNNVAIAAKYLLNKYMKQRVLIVDFDVHHGNGTQELLYDSRNVMYMSIHRFDKGKFYPHSERGGAEFVGEGLGEGYNVNIPFDATKLGNSEYIAAVQTIIVPIAYAFAPEVILVSAGFDAGINDPLGGYRVDPVVFGHIIQLLKPLARGNLILALEGGYNVTTTSYAATVCTKVLLGDPIPTPNNLYKEYNIECKRTINKVIDVHRKYWPILSAYKVLTLVHHSSNL